MKQTHVVIEKQASLQDVKGRIVFTRVISLDGVSVMVGGMSFFITPRHHGFFVDTRRQFEKDAKGSLTREILLENDFEMREIFFKIFATYQNPSLPVLQNTDGDPLVPVKLMYHLNCLPQEAFEHLKSLAVGEDDASLLADAVFDKKGTLLSIRFPWLKKGNPKHPGWENTVMGNIEIAKNRLTAEVNSMERADIIEKEIRKRLGKRALYKKSVISSVQKMVENTRGNGQAANAQNGQLSQEELMQLPEVKAKLSEMARKHWEAWVDIPLPALGNLTPRQAVKDPIGREKLDGLLLDFETMNRKNGCNEFAPDIAGLKKMLGI